MKITVYHVEKQTRPVDKTMEPEAPTAKPVVKEIRPESPDAAESCVLSNTTPEEEPSPPEPEVSEIYPPKVLRIKHMMSGVLLHYAYIHYL